VRCFRQVPGLPPAVHWFRGLSLLMWSNGARDPRIAQALSPHTHTCTHTQTSRHTHARTHRARTHAHAHARSHAHARARTQTSAGANACHFGELFDKLIADLAALGDPHVAQLVQPVPLHCRCRRVATRCNQQCRTCIRRGRRRRRRSSSCCGCARANPHPRGVGRGRACTQGWVRGSAAGALRRASGRRGLRSRPCRLRSEAAERHWIALICSSVAVRLSGLGVSGAPLAGYGGL
jgi:hypothetical protein